VHLVFEDDDVRVLRPMDNQSVGGVNPDGFAIASETRL
jgi:hypothetical protein